MTTSALIDLILTHTEEVGATDGEYATLRLRHLARGQELLDRIYEYADWDFKLTSATVSMTTTGVADLPADFADFGDNGGVFIVTPKVKLTFLEPRELYARKQLNSATSSSPDSFTVNSYTASNGQRKITVYPTPTTTLSLTVYYNQIAPTLADSTDATANNLQGLPAHFHRPVMLKGLQWLSAIDKGDGRVSEFDEWFERALRQMKSRHVFGREGQQSLGQYGGLHSYGSW